MEPPAAGAWERLDFWLQRPQIELSPFANPAQNPLSRPLSFLGAAEVRDMSKVPPQQLIAFPRRTAGQIRALEQVAGSRLKWRVRVGEDSYFSFIPLGSTEPCACTYRMGLRDPEGKLQELFRGPAEPLGPFAPAAVEVSLADYRGKEVDLLLQLDGPPGQAPGQPVLKALWGSPALYQRAAAAPAVRSQGKPNVLLVGIDTLRADALGAWGRKPSFTAELDRLAAESDVWLRAYSTFNVTNPSFASILTGLYGKNHGIYDLKTPLPSEHTTLAELFAQAGYDTMAIVSAHHLGPHNSGLGQGFDDVTVADEHFAAELAVDMTADWLAAPQRAQRPFFAWVHLFDPHTPHTPPQPYAVGFAPNAALGLDPVASWLAFRNPGPRGFDEPVLGGQKDLYDGEVAYLDRQVGRLVGFLESRNLLDNTVLAIVADHGENLGEHGIRYRHLGLWETTTHVPLLIRWPRSGAGSAPTAGHRFSGLVQTLDLFPTLLNAAGLAVPAQDGEDLRKLGDTGRRAVFAEHASQLGIMVRDSRYRYVLSQGNIRSIPDGGYLYDTEQDPQEAVNLVGRGLAEERQLDQLLQRWLAARRPAVRSQSRQLSPEEEQRLRSLGYR